MKHPPWNALPGHAAPATPLSQCASSFEAPKDTEMIITTYPRISEVKPAVIHAVHGPSPVTCKPPECSVCGGVWFSTRSSSTLPLSATKVSTQWYWYTHWGKTVCYYIWCVFSRNLTQVNKRWIWRWWRLWNEVSRPQSNVKTGLKHVPHIQYPQKSFPSASFARTDVQQKLWVKNADQSHLLLQDWQCLKIWLSFKNRKITRAQGQRAAGWCEEYIYSAFEAFRNWKATAKRCFQKYYYYSIYGKGPNKRLCLLWVMFFSVGECEAAWLSTQHLN